MKEKKEYLQPLIMLANRRSKMKRWLKTVIALLLVLMSLVANSGCKDTTSPGTEQLIYITTVTKPSGYISVDISPSIVEATIGQQVTVDCKVLSIINTPVTITVVQLVLFNSEGILLHKIPMDIVGYGTGYERQITFIIAGNEASYKLLVDFYMGIRGNPVESFSEYTIAAVPITIL